MITSDGRSWPARGIAKRRHRLWDRLVQKLEREVEVRDGEDRWRFLCGNLLEFGRAMGLLVKEEGTCRWIREDVQPGDVFYDVGANVGLYTVMAGARVGGDGHVYAFEPHAGNFSRLIRNIVVNGLQQVVTPCGFALDRDDGWLPFNYHSTQAGTSNSQLGTTLDAREADYTPEVSELKRASSADALVAAGTLRPPDHVKIDVDGNEVAILEGMRDILESGERPRSVQIEVNKRDKELIVPFMTERAYELSEKHYTRTGLKKIERGADPEAYTYNAIFRPR